MSRSLVFKALAPIARSTQILALVAAPLWLAGCAVGPDYQRPDSPRVDRYTAQPLPDATATAQVAGGDAQRFLQGREVPQRWWTGFGNDELSRRVRMALEHSPTIASAQASLRQAQENALAARGGLFPAVDAGAGVTRQKQSGEVPGNGNGVGPFNLYNASVSVSYTLDLFGGVRRGIEAQLAQSDYQRAQLDSTYLTLAGNVVTASLQEASLREQVRATEQIVDWQRKTLGITEKQQQFGATSLSDTLAVRSQLATTEATLPPLRAQLAATRNQLATYLGTTPAQLEAAPLTLDAMTLPQDIPVSLPSQLVDQRPDIRAASAQLHAASAQVGVATAAMLPQIALSGSGGSQALHAGDLFSAGTGAWSLGLNLTQPLFRGGELLHKKRAAQAGLDAATADWQQTVLVAFQNVADALQALEFDAQTLAAQATAESAAAQRLDLTRQQYQLGATGYLNLLDAERSYQQARITLIRARAARLSDTAALYTALGGGWRRDADASAPASASSTPSTASN
ncbi:efflux transporter outer membrane subunit [Dyella sp.]|uniref:efflux transporter outer membrane subunit n=1 Tax=Dyella sp. TaxID=1869338 RepID=UPI002D771A8F|nr:efflux transporter outer membrane subunit [Dyella sp.]HET6433773.1 efflux transporter outer membrane subunit [Dyella sp.]